MTTTSTAAPLSNRHKAEFFTYVCNGQADRLRAFLEKYKATTGNCFDVKIETARAKPALLMAIEKNHIPVVDLLIEFGASLSDLSDHKFNPVFTAVEQGSINTLKMLVERGFPYNGTAANGWSALHIAVKKGHTAIIEYLLTLPETKIDALNDKNITPLFLAFKAKNVSIARLLLKHGAGTSAAEQDWTLLHSAIVSRNTELVDLVLEAADKEFVNKATQKGWTALHFACKMANSVAIIKRLLAKDINLDAQDTNGWTALHVATKANNIAAIAALMEAGADPNLHTNKSLTPLLLAFAVKSYGAAAMLLHFTPQNIDNEKPTQLQPAAETAHSCHSASSRGRRFVRPTRPMRRGRFNPDDNGSDAETNAETDATAAEGSDSVATTSSTTVVDRSKIKFVNTTVTDANGWTALHLAAVTGNPDFVTLLTPFSKPLFTVKSTTNKTVLHLGVKSGLQVVEKLLACAPNKAVATQVLNQGDRNGWTPLHTAALLFDFPMVKLLVEAGANPKATDSSNRTPINKLYARGRSRNFANYSLRRFPVFVQKLKPFEDLLGLTALKIKTKPTRPAPHRASGSALDLAEAVQNTRNSHFERSERSRKKKSEKRALLEQGKFENALRQMHRLKAKKKKLYKKYTELPKDETTERMHIFGKIEDITNRINEVRDEMLRSSKGKAYSAKDGVDEGIKAYADEQDASSSLAAALLSPMSPDTTGYEFPKDAEALDSVVELLMADIRELDINDAEDVSDAEVDDIVADIRKDLASEDEDDDEDEDEESNEEAEEGEEKSESENEN